MKRHAMLLLLLASGFAHAGPLALPEAPPAGFTQNLQSRLPLAATFTDDSGKPVRLGSYFDRRPVVLVLGYYHCPNLCSTVMEGVLQTLAAMHLPKSAWRLVEVSIDPTENAALAARKKISFEPMLGRQGGDLHLLTGTQPAIAQLAQAAGFQYNYDEKMRQYAHPAGFLVATPDGRIARYFMGVRFAPKDVRLALVEASAGRIGSPVDRLLLLCSHYDPATGRYSDAVMTLVRVVCLSVLALLLIGMAIHHLWRGRKN